MINKYKWKLLISSIIILLPILMGIVFWNELPQKMTTHWGVDGNADGWSSRPFAVFALPVFMLILHWVCIFFTANDPKNKGQNNKVFGLVLWICPAASLFASGMMYATSFGKDLPADLIGLLLIGLMFVVIGNYLPKCKQNYSIGIKVKWALENEENWNATHRVGGKVWVVGGLLMMACVFLPKNIIPWVLVISLTVLAVVPIVYSYQYYRKQLKEGSANHHMIPKSRISKIIAIMSIVFVVLILVFVGILMFTGDIDVEYGDTSFTIEASFWDNLTVEYNAIDSIEYRDNGNAGTRTNGLGSARLLAGAFQNDEFGSYTRYSYTGCDACVVMTVKGKILVINGVDSESTKNIYTELMARKQ